MCHMYDIIYIIRFCMSVYSSYDSSFDNGSWTFTVNAKSDVLFYVALSNINRLFCITEQVGLYAITLHIFLISILAFFTV